MSVKSSKEAHSVEYELQMHTFKEWINSCLDHTEYKDMKVKDMKTDLSSGLVLIYLMEYLTQKKFPLKYEKAPKLKVQQIANCEVLLAYVQQQDNLHLGGKLSSLAINECGENSNNMKQVIGVIWALIRRYHIPMGSTGFSMKQQLVLWLQRTLADYRKELGDINDFTTCFQNGLAFVALVCKFKPDVLKWDDFRRNKDVAQHGLTNLNAAFKVALEHLKIPIVLRAEDFVAGKLSEACTMTYIAFFCAEVGGIAGSVATAAMERKLRVVLLERLAADKAERQRLQKALADDAMTVKDVADAIGLPIQSKSVLLATLDDEINRREVVEFQLQEGQITAAEVAKKLGLENVLRTAMREQLQEDGKRRNEVEKLLREGKMTAEDAIRELGLTYAGTNLEGIFKEMEEQRKRQADLEAQLADESMGAADALQKLARESEAKALAEQQLLEERKKREEMEQKMKDGAISIAEIAAKLFAETQAKIMITGQLDEERERRMLLEVKVENGVSQLNEARLKYQREIDEKIAMMQQLNGLKEIKASLEAQVASLREQLDYTRQDASTAAERAAAGSDSLAELKSALAVANEKTLQASQKRMEIEETVRELTAKMEEDKASRNVISKQLDEERNNKDEVAQELSRERVSHAENKAKLNALQEMVSKLEERVKEETQAKNVLQAQLSALKDETANVETKAAVTNALAQSSNSQIQATQDALREAQTKQRGVEQILAERTARIAELEAKLQYEVEARSDITAKYQVERDGHLSLVSKNELLKEQQTEQRSEIMKLMSQLNGEQEKNKQNSSQLEDLKQKAQLTDRQLAEATSTTARLTEQVEVMRKESDQMRAQLSITDSANASTDAKVSILKEQLMEAQERGSKSMLDLVNERNEKTNIANQLSSTQADLRHTREKADSLTEEKTALTAAKESLEKDVERLSKDREEHVAELTTLRTTKTTLTKERDTLTEKAADLTGRLERTEKHLAELKAASQMSSGELQQLLTKANGEIDQLSENVRKLEGQNKKLTESVYGLTDFKKLVEEKILCFGPTEPVTKEEKQKRETEQRAKSHTRDRELNQIPAIEATIQRLKKDYNDYSQAIKKNQNVAENEVKLFETSILLQQGQTELDLHTRMGTVAAAGMWEASMRVLEADGSKTRYTVGEHANQRIHAVSNQLRFAREVIGMMSNSEAKASNELVSKARQQELLAGLMKGSLMLKYKTNTGKAVDPHKRYFFFALLQEPTLFWCEYGPYDDVSKTVKFKDLRFAPIAEVYPRASESVISQQSLAFETGKLSFSILTAMPKNTKGIKKEDYTIDLVAPNEEVHTLWTSGLATILQQFRTGFVGAGVGVPMRVELVLQREMGNPFDYNKMKLNLEANVKRATEEQEKLLDNLIKNIKDKRVETEKNVKLNKGAKDEGKDAQLVSKIDVGANVASTTEKKTRQAVRLFVDKNLGLSLDTLVVWALENQSHDEFYASVIGTVNSRSEKPFSTSDVQVAFSINDGEPKPLPSDSTVLGLYEEHSNAGIKIFLLKGGTLALPSDSKRGGGGGDDGAAAEGNPALAD